MTRVLATGTAEFVGHDFSLERSILGEETSIERLHYAGDVDALCAAARDADAILTDFVPFGAAMVESLQNCRVISVAATGFDCVDVAAANAAGIRVCAIREYCTDEVADHTMLLILALMRRLLPYHAHVQQYGWQFDAFSGLHRLRGKTLGIVGFGRIGRAVARRAAAFGMNVIAHDPFPPAESPDDVCLVGLDSLLENADVISLHCNLSESTRDLIGADAFSRMRRRPIFINVARGGLVSEEAVSHALDAGHIRAAGLDVLDSEFPDLAVSPLVGRDDVLLTPHVAFYSDESLEQSRRISVANIRHCLDGRHDLVDRYVGDSPAPGVSA